MIPLLVTGAVSLASDVVDAWKQHAANTAATQAVNSADFQKSLSDAATKLATDQLKQQAAAAPGELKEVTQEILQSPDVQSMARMSTNGSISLQFDSSGHVYATTAGGKTRQIMVDTNESAQLSQLNALMRNSQTGLGETAQMTGQIHSSNLPVSVSLAAIA